MLRRLLLMVLSLLVVASWCSGCREATPARPTTLSVLFNERDAVPYRKDWLIVKEYEKQQNIVLDVRLGDDASYDEDVAQVFASGQVPDIVLKVWPGPMESYAKSGRLLPFSDYEDRMPHFMAYVEAHGLAEEIDRLRLDDGKYYVLPGYQRPIQVQQWIYRRDLFEKHNLGTPSTYDELYDALVTLKALYPESTPITACWGGAHLFAMMGAGYDIPAGWNGARYYDEANDRWRFAPATENYRAMHAFLHRCYQAGVLDPAIFDQSDAEYMAKLQDGRALVTVTWVSSGFDSWNQKLEENGVAGGEWVPLPVPESTIGIRALPPVDPFRKGLVVPSEAAEATYFEELIAFLDWAVYSDAGMTLTTWGVEGETFEQTDQGREFLPHIKTVRNPDGDVDPNADLGLQLLFDLNEDVAYEDYKRPPDIVAFLAKSLEAQEAGTVDPTLQLDSDAIEAIRIIDEQITPFVAESSQGFVTGELSVKAGWDDYVLELEAMGYKTMEEIWNVAWAKQRH